MRKILLVLVVAALLAGVGGWQLYHADRRPASFRAARVERGDLVAMVSASGTIEPEEVVDVGARVAPARSSASATTRAAAGR